MARLINTQTLSGGFEDDNNWRGVLVKREYTDLKNMMLMINVEEADAAFTLDIRVSVKTSLANFSAPLKVVALPDDPGDPNFLTLREIPIRLTELGPARLIYEAANLDRTFELHLEFSGSTEMKVAVEMADA